MAIEQRGEGKSRGPFGIFYLVPGEGQAATGLGRSVGKEAAEVRGMAARAGGGAGRPL